MDAQTLERDFSSALAVFTGDGSYDDFFAFFEDDALLVNEDIPFILDKDAYKDHMGFLAENMSMLEWIVREPRYQVYGDTGIVSAELTVRGKPNNAGFRQRHSVMTAVCHWNGSAWRGANLHTSTLLAHIYHMSPG